MPSSSALRLFLASLLLLCLPALLPAQSYTSILVFGDSLSDTGNVAHLTQSQYLVRIPGPAVNYTSGSFTDGTDTAPPAALYTGVWIKQLAATFPAHPTVIDSLDGGSNYSFGYARNGNGTSTLQISSAISVNVDNVGQQVTDYFANHSTVPAGTLVVVWAGANDLLNATSTTDLTTAATNEIAAIQRLIAAGATDFLVPNLPPIGAIPRLNTNAAAAAQATAASQAFNTALAAGLSSLPAANPGKTLHLFPLDVFSLFSSVIASPTANGLSNVTLSSQGQSVNPDNYLFWDDLHPTTAGHHLIATAASTLLNTPTSIATTSALTLPASSISLGSSITLTAAVTAAAGTTPPAGTVTFFDGTTSLGTATLNSSTGLTSFATIATSSLTAGTHTLTTSYTANGAFTASTSSSVTLTVVPPGISVTANPTTITVAAGSTGTSTLTVTPMGGFSGSVNIACTGAPTNAFCYANTTPPVSFSSTQTFTLSVVTNGTTPAQPAGLLPTTLSGLGILTGLLSSLSLAALAIARRRGIPAGLLTLLVLAGSFGILGLAGCGGGHNAARGTYNLTVTTTPSTSGTSSSVGAAVTTPITLIIQ